MKTVQKKENVVARKIHGGFFLIDICDNYAGDKCAIHEINETGMFLWECMQGKTTVASLAQKLCDAIIDEVDYAVILSDVSEYIDTLAAEGFVEVEENG